MQIAQLHITRVISQTISKLCLAASLATLPLEFSFLIS